LQTAERTAEYSGQSCFVNFWSVRFYVISGQLGFMSFLVRQVFGCFLSVRFYFLTSVDGQVLCCFWSVSFFDVSSQLGFFMIFLISQVLYFTFLYGHVLCHF